LLPLRDFVTPRKDLTPEGVSYSLKMMAPLVVQAALDSEPVSVIRCGYALE